MKLWALSSFVFVGIVFAILLIYHQIYNLKINSAVIPVTSQKSPISPISLQDIFQKDHSWTMMLSAKERITVIATGDVIPARSVNYQTIKNSSFVWPFEKTADVVKNADVTFINLETPLLKDCRTTQEGMVFCGDLRHIEGLQFAGVDIASLANNHAGNYGEKGVSKTEELLLQNGIKTVGTGNILYNTTKETRFAFLGYNDITSPQPGVEDADEEKIKKDIQEARNHADIIIVTYHWGVEYRDQPDDRQKYLGHMTIDAGADLVIGNHPHWIQPVEIYKNKLITYAHGNYIFDQMWSEETKLGVIGRYTFYNKQLVDVEFLPIRIIDYGQPYFLRGDEKQKVLDAMEKESKLLMSAH